MRHSRSGNLGFVLCLQPQIHQPGRHSTKGVMRKGAAADRYPQRRLFRLPDQKLSKLRSVTVISARAIFAENSAIE